MIHLRSIRYVKPVASLHSQFPFYLPLIDSLEEIHFDSPVTFLVGENGTGKSTFIEALAAAVGSIAVGAQSVQTDPTLEHARKLARQFKLVWQLKKTHRGFFLRAEDFFNFAKQLAQTRVEMEERLTEIEEEYKSRSAYAKSLAELPVKGSLHAMKSRYGEDLDANSHGESFLKLFQSRFVPNGLYLLDEPEAPLSPMRQLALMVMLRDMVDQNSQFIIATHSPILMAFPGAKILSFDETPVREVRYDELEHVTLTRSFLNNPEQYLRHLGEE